MIALLTKARAYLGIITAAVIAFLYLLAKYFRGKAVREKERADRAETQILRKEEMDEIERQVDESTDIRTQELADKIEAGESVDLTRWPDES